MENKNSGLQNVPAKEFVLNEFSKGYSECIDNNWNYAIYAQDPNVSIFQNEYIAGYIQGKVQGELAIRSARNNTWSNYLIGYTPQDDISITLPDGALELAQNSLIENYTWLYKWVVANQDDLKVINIKRLMYRMYGIFAGVNCDKPCDNISFEDLDPTKISPDQMKLHISKDAVTFLDVYFINAQMDMFDAIGDKIGVSFSLPLDGKPKSKPDHCSAFVKFMPDGEIFWTHNSWSCFYAQSCAITYCIGDDFVTQNAYCQGQFGSNTDFGFNKHGIGFNETTHVWFYNKPKVIGVWLTWRSAAAEQFASTIQEFYDYCKIDNTATYLNGYQLVDVNRGLIGLIDMSYDRFALFTSDGSDLKIIDSTGYEPTFLDYDHHLISPTHIFGINQPIYKKINYELESMNVRPMRRVQFFRNLNWVGNIEDAKNLITYTEDKEPLSIYGRWDLGYGTTEFPRTRPDGSMDAKAFSANGVKEVLANLTCVPSLTGTKTSFWMKFGTPHIEGKPFQWSNSMFKSFKSPQSEDFVPDILDGRWNKVKMFME